MITLTLDGQPVDVLAFCAWADEREERNGFYRLEVLHSDHGVERCWALATGVQCYDRLCAISGDGGFGLLDSD